MKISIKVGHKTFYLDKDDWEKEKQFIKNQEI